MFPIVIIAMLLTVGIAAPLGLSLGAAFFIFLGLFCAGAVASLYLPKWFT